MERNARVVPPDSYLSKAFRLLWNILGWVQCCCCFILPLVINLPHDPGKLLKSHIWPSQTTHFKAEPMDRYVILEEILGTRTNGTVGKAMEIMTGNIFTIKKLKRSFSAYEECLNIAEVRCMRELVHPNLISLHEVIMESNTLYLVLECMDCDLTQLMKLRGHPFSEQEVRNLFFQLFKGLAYMHEQGYCHRDLKPNNLLVCGDTIKIADFGLATNLLLQSGQPLRSYVVTRPYRAPELLLGSTDYDFAIDIWAMGVIMAQLLAGCNLFGGSRRAKMHFTSISFFFPQIFLLHLYFKCKEELVGLLIPFLA